MGRRKKVVPRQRNVRGGGWLEWRNGQWLARYVRNGKKLSKMTGTADKAVAEKMLQELSLENRLSDEKRELERIGRERRKCPPKLSRVRDLHALVDRRGQFCTVPRSRRDFNSSVELVTRL